MPIKFREQIEKQKKLILVLLGVVLIGGFIVWWGYYREPPVPGIIAPEHLKKIKVDLGVLDDPLLEELRPIEKIPPFEEEVGRENPFLPAF